MSKGKKIGKVFISLVLWVIILLAAMFAFITLATRNESSLASIGGVTPLVIQSDSMKPTFEKGDVIFIRKVDPEKLSTGDVITFHTIIENEYALNTHRIVEIYEESGMRHYVTQGDNNTLKDTHVIVDGDIVGKYMNRWPGFGKVIDILSSKWGFFLILVVPMLIFFVYQLYHLIMVSIELKKANAIEAALATQEASSQKMDDAEKALEDARRMQAEAEAALARAKALEEARRLQAEAEAALARAKALEEQNNSNQQ